MEEGEFSRVEGEEKGEGVFSRVVELFSRVVELFSRVEGEGKGEGEVTGERRGP